jgi:hypothetical protein
VATFPPSLADVKLDLRIDDTVDDDALQLCVDAAIAFVIRRLGGTYNLAVDPFSSLPGAPSDVLLGTVRLAGRWYTRRRSPDGLIATADFGTSRIPSIDADIERLLRIGRYSAPVIG